jgi:hypothetical protein
MIDYGPGDEIVCVKPVTPPLKQNGIYICEDVRPTDRENSFLYVCSDCGTNMSEAICVWIVGGRNEYCNCLFRKKLDFKKLCNVDERMPVSA